ncbi:MAG: bacillithiol biosynthesis cysteine-adding enzyme BshC [Bacillota bacterium]|nr:bacillithiol biosynthesis cysteine-adding enzyme BshC [Bacillota bacterium]
MTLARLWPAAPLFPGTAPDDEAFLARREYLQTLWPSLLRRSAHHRERLAGALVAYQKKIGGGKKAQEAAQALADPGTLAVVTGQQIGLFTGPAYTVYKALTAILWAQRLEDALGQRVVPVFWIATEDHDYQEATRVSGWNPERGLERFGLPPGPLLRSVGRLPIPPAAAEEVGRFLEAAPHGGDWLEGFLRDTLQASRDLGEWFARQMALLFGGEPLVFLDPMDPSLRTLGAPALAHLMEAWQEVGSGLLETTARIREAGEEPQLLIDPQSLQLFRYHQGRRLLLLRDGDKTFTRKGEWELPLGSLPEKILEEPQNFSPAAALRPLLQDWLLPTLGQVAGPGELRYLPQLEGAFAAAGWARALAVPRLSFTLLWPQWEEKAQEWGLDLNRLESWHQVRQQWEENLLARRPYPIDPAFVHVRAALETLYRRLGEDLAGLGEGYARVLQENQSRVLHQIGYLEEKAHQHLRRLYRQEYRAWQRWMEALWPQGKPQERVYSFLALMGPFGPEGIEAFFRAAHLEHPHQWVLVQKKVPCV